MHYPNISRYACNGWIILQARHTTTNIRSNAFKVHPKHKNSICWSKNCSCIFSIILRLRNRKLISYHVEQKWQHVDVAKWKHFPRYWPFVWGIHWSLMNSPHKGQWPRRFDVFFDLRLNKRLSKHSWGYVNIMHYGGLKVYKLLNLCIIISSASFNGEN